MRMATIQAEVTKWADEKGWRFTPEQVPEKLMLIVTEVAEAMECYRREEMITSIRKSDNKPEGFASELADTVIRLLHLAGTLGIDLESEIELKMFYNQSRPHRHGGLKA